MFYFLKENQLSYFQNRQQSNVIRSFQKNKKEYGTKIMLARKHIGHLSQNRKGINVIFACIQIILLNHP